MKLIKRNSDHLVVNTDQSAVLSAEGIGIGTNSENRSYNTSNATEVTGVTPLADFVKGAHGYNNGWIMVNQARYDAQFAKWKTDKKIATDSEYEKRMTGGITYQGLPVQSSDRAVINIIGANRNPNATRKNVIGGQPMTISAVTAAALETAIVTYTDALGERRHDLYVAINAAADNAALSAVNPASGWPSNSL